MISSTRDRREAGFTLLELMVALAIAAILVLAQVAPFQRAIVSRDRAEEALDGTSAVRVTLQRMAEEISGALPLAGAPFVLADRTLDLPASEIRFATTGARRIRGGPQDPIERVTYRLEPPRRGDVGGRLVKEQIPSVAAPGTPPATVVVLDGVAAFRARVQPKEGQPWVESWEGGAGGSGTDLPRAVEIEISLVDRVSDPIPFHLALTLPMRGRS